MKKLVNIALLVFISSCVPFSMLEIKDIPNEMPRKVIINQDDSGLVVYNDSVYRINNLEITKNKIPLNDSKSNYPISYANSYEDSDSNTLIYARNLNTNEVKSMSYFSTTFFDTGNALYQFYNIKITKSNSNFYVSKELFKDFGDLTIEIDKQVSKNNSKYFLLCGKEIIDDFRNVSLKVLNNDILEEHQLDIVKTSNNTRFYQPPNFYFPKVNIDNSGNGFFSYYPNKRYFSIFKLKNYEKKESLYNEDLSENKYWLDSLENNLDLNGNGFILYLAKDDSYQNNKVFLAKFQDFKKISEDKIIGMTDKKLLDIKINSEGNGYILLSSVKPKSIYATLDTYIKKIADFKVVEVDNKILDANDDLKEYYDSSINEKGDGLIVFKSADPDIKNKFKIVKIRNYELSK